jgi:hypothetical protein
MYEHVAYDPSPSSQVHRMAGPWDNLGTTEEGGRQQCARLLSETLRSGFRAFAIDVNSSGIRGGEETR